MFKDREYAPSLTRKYVAICNRPDFDGLYFRYFTLPKEGDIVGYYDQIGRWTEGSYTPFYPNTAAMASWYFTNILDTTACIDGCIAVEQYWDVEDQDEIELKRMRDDIDSIFKEARK